MGIPDLLDRWALGMRARARGLRASREAYWTAHDQSYIDDYRVAGERDDARRAFQELCSTEQARVLGGSE